MSIIHICTCILVCGDGIKLNACLFIRTYVYERLYAYYIFVLINSIATIVRERMLKMAKLCSSTTTDNIQPQFLTNKFTIESLSTTKNVYDFQLKEHFITKSNLNTLQCSCSSHKHNKQPCIIVTEPFCVKCKTPTAPLISFQSLMFHQDLMHKKLTKCCIHTHKPPCDRCINCRTKRPCIIVEPFECVESTG